EGLDDFVVHDRNAERIGDALRNILAQGTHLARHGDQRHCVLLSPCVPATIITSASPAGRACVHPGVSSRDARTDPGAHPSPSASGVASGPILRPPAHAFAPP